MATTPPFDVLRHLSVVDVYDLRIVPRPALLQAPVASTGATGTKVLAPCKKLVPPRQRLSVSQPSHADVRAFNAEQLRLARGGGFHAFIVDEEKYLVKDATRTTRRRWPVLPPWHKRCGVAKLRRATRHDAEPAVHHRVLYCCDAVMSCRARDDFVRSGSATESAPATCCRVAVFGRHSTDCTRYAGHSVTFGSPTHARVHHRDECGGAARPARAARPASAACASGHAAPLVTVARSSKDQHTRRLFDENAAKREELARALSEQP
jgi:hypothetical protein